MTSRNACHIRWADGREQYADVAQKLFTVAPGTALGFVSDDIRVPSLMLQVLSAERARCIAFRSLLQTASQSLLRARLRFVPRAREAAGADTPRMGPEVGRGKTKGVLTTRDLRTVFRFGRSDNRDDTVGRRGPLIWTAERRARGVARYRSPLALGCLGGARCAVL